MNKCIVLVVAAVLALAATSQAYASNTLSAGAVAHGFFKTVFGLEYGAHADAHRVKRFASPVRFHIDDRSGVERLPAVRSFLARLPSRIRNLKAYQVTDPSMANFKVIVVRAADFAHVVATELDADAVAMNARCIVGVTSLRGEIQESVAIIVGDHDYLFSRCLVEEVLQGLGPMNDSRDLPHSVFNDTSKHTHFTAFDAAILNVLYHPAVRPGMTGREAHQALRTAFRDLGYSH